MAERLRQTNLKQLSEGAKVYDLDDDGLKFSFTKVLAPTSSLPIKKESSSASPGTAPSEALANRYLSASSDIAVRDQMKPFNDVGENISGNLGGNASPGSDPRMPPQQNSHTEESVSGMTETGIPSKVDVSMSDHGTLHADATGDREPGMSPSVGLAVNAGQKNALGDVVALLSNHEPLYVQAVNGIEPGSFPNRESQCAGEKFHRLSNHHDGLMNHQPPPHTIPDVEVTHEINQTNPAQDVPVMDLGSSIFQQKAAVPLLDPAAARQAMLEQQKAMAALFKANNSLIQRREEEQPTNPDDDQTIYQGQKIGPIVHPFDFELTFKEKKRIYHNKKTNGTTTLEDDTQYLKAERDYGRQKARINRESRGEAITDEDDDEQMFVQDRNRGSKSKSIARKKGKGQNTNKGKRKGNGSDSDQDYEERPAKKAKGRSKTRKSTAKSRKSTENRTGRLNPQSFGISNVFGDAQVAEGLQRNQPGWEQSDNIGKNKTKALRALMRNVPTEARPFARTDRSLLNHALKSYTGVGSVKPAEGGKWLVSGMSTSLTPHQVIAGSFMRVRESRADQPKGGILADQMGLGKTLMTLANIVNGRPNPNIVAGRGISPDQNYTTLIVVPPALITQWHEEIKKHLVKKKRNTGWGIGTVLHYNERSCGMSDVEDLYEYDIILTTYGEVQKSWPVVDMPPMEDGDEKEAWLQEHFYDKRGLLHKATFLRVCLDEAHCIRNVDTRTSQACRNLVGEHCWAITGTPMVNGSFDLYGLFEFIRHPTVKCPNGFRRKYVDPQNPMSVDKFSDDLSSCMSRFTHRDHLFGARLVNLPKARGETLRLDFTRLEFAIYEIVRTRFATRVQQMSDEGKLRSKLTHIWVLMLRLRQLTAHPLMIQGEICSCLEREDFEKLDRLVARESSTHGDGANLILSIRNVMHRERAAAERSVAEDHQDGADEQYQLSLGAAIPREPSEGDLKGSGGAHGRNMRFSKYLDVIKGSETYKRVVRGTKCCVCQQTPHEPHITDCFHFYCKVCLEDSVYEAAENGHDKASCASCGKEMTANPTEAIAVEDDNDNEGSRNGKKKSKRGKSDSMEDWLDMKGEILPSSKTIATKCQILNWWDPLAGGDPDVKVIVFTQWLGMVKVLGKMCETEKWGYCTLTGDLSIKRRDTELKRFRNDAETKILISSLRCGGLGLNLTVASKVIIIDPWWNEAIEQQAFCRVFRIGQDKETSMVNLAIKNSIDDRLFELKESKKTEIEKVMLDHKQRRKVDLRTVLSVFGTVSEDENGRLFFSDLKEGEETSDDEDNDDMA